MEPGAHIRQSISDIVTTPIGARIMRPEYGSRLPRLIDNPMTQSWKLAVYAAVAEAIRRWEPRVIIERVSVDAVGSGYIELFIDYKLEGNADAASITVGQAA
jgi:phage baseplate assembly protein W